MLAQWSALTLSFLALFLVGACLRSEEPFFDPSSYASVEGTPYFFFDSTAEKEVGLLVASPRIPNTYHVLKPSELNSPDFIKIVKFSKDVTVLR